MYMYIHVDCSGSETALVDIMNASILMAKGCDICYFEPL